MFHLALHPSINNLPSPEQPQRNNSSSSTNNQPCLQQLS